MSARLLAAGFTVHGLDNSPTTWAALADADQTELACWMLRMSAPGDDCTGD